MVYTQASKRATYAYRDRNLEYIREKNREYMARHREKVRQLKQTNSV